MRQAAPSKAKKFATNTIKTISTKSWVKRGKCQWCKCLTAANFFLTMSIVVCGLNKKTISRNHVAGRWIGIRHFLASCARWSIFTIFRAVEPNSIFPALQFCRTFWIASSNQFPARNTSKKVEKYPFSRWRCYDASTLLAEINKVNLMLENINTTWYVVSLLII